MRGGGPRPCRSSQEGTGGPFPLLLVQVFPGADFDHKYEKFPILDLGDDAKSSDLMAPIFSVLLTLEGFAYAARILYVGSLIARKVKMPSLEALSSFPIALSTDGSVSTL